jgi:ATP-dependent DNA helicase PIF1
MIKRTFGNISSNIAAANQGTKMGWIGARAPAHKAEDSKIEVIPEYRKIKKLLDDGCPVVFVTGGAGTGKSTLIRWLENVYSGQIVLCAPTGIAALTIGGKTLHSFCGFPPGWIIDKDIRIKAKSPAAAMKIFVIDEISMVNANLLDGVSDFLKRNRTSKEPFGGVSLVIVGDLFQLPPVITNSTRALFKSEYETPKFFSAHALNDSEVEAVELTKPFRQTDIGFVHLLANVREGKDLLETLTAINAHCKITDEPTKGAVWLCPRHADVDRVNTTRLAKLDGKSVSYKGVMEGAFKESQLPVPLNIELKIGAQVVLTNNTKDWVNGSVAVVTDLFKEKIQVRLLGAQKVVEVPMNTWEQYDYVVDDNSKVIVRTVIGTFRQIPAILAWAMTIHRSQGLTLDAVHLDLGIGAFETGQTYVALSRVRDINRLTLSRPIRFDDIRVDQESSLFYKNIRE